MDIGQTQQDRKTLFSYVVFKKGSRDDDKTINWPRMVRPTQVRTRHTRCKFCTHRGKLEEVVVTKGKHSKYVQYSKVIYSFSNSIALIRLFLLFFLSPDTLTDALEKAIGVIVCLLNSRKMNVIPMKHPILATMKNCR